MRSSHVIYGVHDLAAAKREWEERGFVVEYGKSKNPFNALIYFSEGPFIELLQVGKTSASIRFFISLLKISRNKGAYARFQQLLHAPEGWIDLAIECDPYGLQPWIKHAQALGFPGTYLKYSSRRDTKGRNLRFQNYFPDDLNLPFLMSYYQIDPKPKNFVHPNGVKGIAKISIETSPRCVKALQALYSGQRLEIHTGEKLRIRTVEFETSGENGNNLL